MHEWENYHAAAAAGRLQYCLEVIRRYRTAIKTEDAYAKTLQLTKIVRLDFFSILIVVQQQATNALGDKNKIDLFSRCSDLIGSNIAQRIDDRCIKVFF